MRCIYCLNTKCDSEFNIEHVIPRAFGDFPTTNTSPRLVNCVCSQCNQYFGDGIDNFFSRHSFEGIRRLETGVTSDARGAHKQVYFQIAKLSEDPNAASPIFYMDRERKKLDIAYGLRLHSKNNESNFINLLLNTNDPSNPRLCCLDPGASFNPVEWVGSIGRFEIWCKDESQKLLMLSLLKKHGIDIDLTDREPTLIVESIGAASGNEKFIVSAFVNREIFRAVSKILFNYAAFHLGQDQVLAAHWDRCRKFIRHDIGDIGTGISTDPFWDNEIHGLSVSTDGIDVRFENGKGNVVGRICFYGYWSYHVVLAEGLQLPSDSLVGCRFYHQQEPLSAVHVKKGLGIYLPFQAMNSVGQIVTNYRKI